MKGGLKGEEVRRGEKKRDVEEVKRKWNLHCDAAKS